LEYFSCFLLCPASLLGKEEKKMPERPMDEILASLGDDIILEFDAIARAAHGRFRAYAPADLIELDSRAQAACTYSHMLAEAYRRFDGRSGVRALDIRNLKVWHFEQADVVIRLKKMDEDGRSRNYPTKQAKAFDGQMELPGLPSPPIRLTAGYLLDATGTELIRSQISLPLGREIEWCVAVVPETKRTEADRVWEDVTRQARAAL
jgi:hypothetical protein